MKLENYILNLKISVGLNTLVKPVGVGKGKEDLTGFIAQKSNMVCQEMPDRKYWSRLTYIEIKSILRGDFIRLISKA